MTTDRAHSLEGKRAVVCGSTQGIGRACAEEFARRVATVTLVARHENSLRQVGGALSTDAHQRHDYICVDFAEPDVLQRKVRDFLGTAGTVHVLLNNTGGPPAGPVLDARPEEFVAAFTRHLICNHVLAQAVIPGMKDAGYGRIINIVSTSVREPIAGLGVSNTIRGAVASWAKTLSAEVAPFGITVNNVLPGATRTTRLASLIKGNAEKQGTSVEEIEKNLLARIPAGRFADAGEIAAAAGFLASPAAGYVTGVSVPVDGGRISCL